MSANTKCFMSLHNNNMCYYVTRKCEIRNAWFVRYPICSLVNARNRCHFKCHPKHKIAAHSPWQLLCGQAWGFSVTAIFSNYSFDNGKLTTEIPHVAICVSHTKRNKKYFFYTHFNLESFSSALKRCNLNFNFESLIMRRHIFIISEREGLKKRINLHSLRKKKFKKQYMHTCIYCFLNFFFLREYKFILFFNYVSEKKLSSLKDS